MTEPPRERHDEVRERALQAEADGDWAEAEAQWSRLDPADAERAAALERVAEKRRIFGKIESMLPGGGRHSYIGLDDRVTVDHDGIRVRFPLRMRDVDLASIVGALRRARLKFEERLGYRHERAEVELFPTRETMRAAAAVKGERPADWAVATADDTILVALDGPEGRERHRLTVTLTHEFTHLAIRSLTAGRCPRWLDEGVAVALSQELPQHYRAALSAAVAEERCLPLDRLSDVLTGTEADEVPLAYAQSASLVAFLIEDAGWPGLRELLETLSQSDLDEALKRRAWSPYLLERAWLRWTRARSGEP